MVPDISVAEFVTECLAVIGGLPPPATPAEEADMAQRTSKDWSTRESVSRKYRHPVLLTTTSIAQFATVINYKSMIVNSGGRAAAHLAFAPRNHGSAGDVQAVVAIWQKNGETWELGKGRDFFWIAPVIDFSTIAPARLSDGLGQVYRDVLGLCHWGAADTLLRIGIPASVATALLSANRPTAFDGLDNPAFRGARDGEVGVTAALSGLTVDVFKVDMRDPNIDGAPEWIAAPIAVSTGQLFWEYLGIPKMPECSSKASFHDAMLMALESTTPITRVLPELKSLV